MKERDGRNGAGGERLCGDGAERGRNGEGTEKEEEEEEYEEKEEEDEEEDEVEEEDMGFPDSIRIVPDSSRRVRRIPHRFGMQKL